MPFAPAQPDPVFAIGARVSLRAGSLRGDPASVPGEQVSRAVEMLGGSVAARGADPHSRVTTALAFGRTVGSQATTLVDRWEMLATVAAADLAMARALEPHLDARGIFDEARLAGEPIPDAAAASSATWGVFAAEGGATPLLATALAGGDWTLSGEKAWCSLAGILDRALVTARTSDGSRILCAVDLHHPGVTVLAGSWQARGLTEIPSGPVSFDSVAAVEVGAPGWYLERPGFATGGIGVAACWFGGAVGIARTLFAAIAASASPSPFAVMHLGAIDRMLGDARRALAEAAALVSTGSLTGEQGAMLARRVRGTVAGTCEAVIERTGHALGPAPLALDADHAKRVADLQLYIRQYHAERDEEALGRSLLESPEVNNRSATDGQLPW